MDQFEPILSRCPLFEGICREDMAGLLSCLGGKIVSAAKGSPVFLEGDPARFIAVLLSGRIQIVRDDYYGNRSVLTVVSPGGYFGEAFACAGLETMPVSALATQPSTVLLLDCHRVLTGCAQACDFHSRLVHNLLRCLAQKNLLLTRKIRCMAPKTTREKLLEFLTDQAKQQGSPSFVIPYDRQTLADYLGVERSAMSAEIGKLRREGLLESRGSWFRLLSPQLRENE